MRNLNGDYPILDGKTVLLRCGSGGAIIKTLTEIGELNDCGIISDEEFVRLGRELQMK